MISLRTGTKFKLRIFTRFKDSK